MAGTLTISTLSDGTNSTSATNCIQGSAKAWVNFNGTSGSISSSFNTSSVTRNGTGDYTVNFTTALPNTNYAYFGTGRRNAGTQRPINFSQDNSATYNPSTTSLRFVTWVEAAASLEDALTFNIAILSS
jgi:N-methylhydantoinase B/oxoprolinase/acetone carboxylase alpha subunit